jgi:hypothetical protein
MGDILRDPLKEVLSLPSPGNFRGSSQRRVKSQSRLTIEESQSARIPDGSEASVAIIAVKLCCN